MKTETVADRIRQARQITALNQEQFGKAINVSKSAVSQWELGKTELSPTSLFSIERRFGIRAEWIATGEGPKTYEEEGIRPPLTEKQKALLVMMESLTPAQQDEVMKSVASQKQSNEEIVDALASRKKAS